MRAPCSHPRTPLRKCSFIAPHSAQIIPHPLRTPCLPVRTPRLPAAAPLRLANRLEWTRNPRCDVPPDLSRQQALQVASSLPPRVPPLPLAPPRVLSRFARREGRDHVRVVGGAACRGCLHRLHTSAAGVKKPIFSLVLFASRLSSRAALPFCSSSFRAYLPCARVCRSAFTPLGTTFW